MELRKKIKPSVKGFMMLGKDVALTVYNKSFNDALEEIKRIAKRNPGSSDQYLHEKVCEKIFSSSQQIPTRHRTVQKKTLDHVYLLLALKSYIHYRKLEQKEK